MSVRVSGGLVTRRRRVGAVVSFAVVIGAIVAVAAGVGTGQGEGAREKQARTNSARHQARHRGAAHSAPTALQRGTGIPGTVNVPILMYHVINAPPAGAPFPGLYVLPDEFVAQMRALKAAGWHAVTLDQLRANWMRGVPLGPGKPIVLTFDNGYESQYTNALPVLKQLGWVADENMQLSGLPPSQGGLTDDQVKGLVAAGWELDTQGISHADLVTLDPSELQHQIASARQILRSRYGVPVNWFCYPSGHYNPAVIDAVRAAGFVGSTTVEPGWAGPHSDPFRLPRLRVLGERAPPRCCPKSARRRETGRRHPATERDVTDHQIDTPDGRILQVLERGDPAGRPILVHNGTPNSRLLFDRDVVRAERQGIRLISYDRPGYGGSTGAQDEPSATVRRTCARSQRPLGSASWGCGGYREADPTRSRVPRC